MSAKLCSENDRTSVGERLELLSLPQGIPAKKDCRCIKFDTGRMFRVRWVLRTN